MIISLGWIHVYDMHTNLIDSGHFEPSCGDVHAALYFRFNKFSKFPISQTVGTVVVCRKLTTATCGSQACNCRAQTCKCFFFSYTSIIAFKYAVTLKTFN